MWTGLLVLVVLGGLVGLGQWYVTRPSDRRPIDPRRARASGEAKYGKDPSGLNDTGVGGF